MPEGDSLHRAAARLQVLVGERVEASSPNPRGLVTGVARAVDGRVLESVEAVGKNLLLRFEGDVTVRSHLRMNGRWRVRAARARGQPRAAVARPPHAGWEATQWNGPVLTLDASRTRRLGPDLLADATRSTRSSRAFRRADPRRLVGDVLVDQRVVAGIGNMWLAELLWHARISPWLPVGEATDEELDAALAWGRDAMRRSVAGERPAARRLPPRRAGLPALRSADPLPRPRRA